MKNESYFPQPTTPANDEFSNEFNLDNHTMSSIVHTLIENRRKVLEGAADYVLWQVEGHTCLFQARRDHAGWRITAREFGGTQWYDCSGPFLQLAFGWDPASVREPVPPDHPIEPPPEEPGPAAVDAVPPPEYDPIASDSCHLYVPPQPVDRPDDFPFAA